MFWQESNGTETRGHPHRIQISAKFERSNSRGKIHRKDLAHTGKRQVHRVGFYTKRVQHSRFGGILKQKNGRDTIHFNTDASNTELLFRNIHSENQLSIHRAIANWCEQFGLTKEEKGQEKLKDSVTKGAFLSCVEPLIGPTFPNAARSWRLCPSRHAQRLLVLPCQTTPCTATPSNLLDRHRICTDSSGTIFYLRVFQGHSGRNIIDPPLQDNVVIPDGFFKYIYQVGCAINLHSIINSGLIPGGKNLSNRQTVFFLPVAPMDKNHKDPNTIDLNAPRHAQYMHKAWKRHQDAVYWVDINLAPEERIEVSIRLDRTPSFFTKHSQLIVFRKLLGWKLEKSCTRKYMRHLGPLQRSPWNMTGWKNWVQKMLNAKRDKLCNNSKVPNQTNQFQIQIMIERCNPLLEQPKDRVEVEEKRPVLRRSKHVLFMKKLSNMIERGNPLVKQEHTKHVHLMTARASTLKIKTAHDRTVATRCKLLHK